MTKANGAWTPQSDEVLFVALGGVGEIGMNLALYGHAGAWLMVDLGITFGDDRTPGVDVILPDPGFIAERREQLAGLVLTHGHEDHLGAVPYIWPQLRCPVYATPFTASLLRRKLMEVDLDDVVPIVEIPLDARFDVGPFSLQMVTVTHSIPEPNAVAIRTPVGLLLHSGDWKLDPDPVIGAIADETAFRALGDEGVLSMVSDSTNAVVDGVSGSEGALRASLIDLVGRCAQRVVVGCFATNVARLDSIAAAAAAHGRHVALVGRSLRRIDDVAREHGYLEDLPPFVDEHDAGFLPRDKVVLVCTGSQGEPRAALHRIAAGTHPNIELEAGDTVIFSSRVIPGNERAIGRLQNRLMALGVEVVTARDHFVHVSGHPARDELSRMYGWVRPKSVIPVHGETRHLMANAELAQSCGVVDAPIIADGTVVRLTALGPEIVGAVETGRLALDGGRLVPLNDGPIRGRQRMLHNGAAVVSLVVDDEGVLLADPQISLQGLMTEDEKSEIFEELVDVLRDALTDLPRKAGRDDNKLKEAARVVTRRALRDTYGKRPLTEVHLTRIPGG